VLRRAVAGGREVPLAGLAFMSLMSSATSFALTSLFTTSMFGTRAMSVTATKSFTGS
jgi:hypothetical protein